MICPICSQHVPIDDGNAHLQAHLVAGEAAIFTDKNGRSSIYATTPAVINCQTGETTETAAALPPALAWLQALCQQVSMEWFLKL